MPYQNILQISGTGPYGLGQGSDLRADYTHFAIEGNWTGSFLVCAQLAGEPNGWPHYCINLLNNTVVPGNSTITQSLGANQYMVRSDARNVIISASAWTGGTASLYYAITQGT